MEIITSETGVAISLVITALGGVVWLTKLHGMASANRETIKVNSRRIESIEQNGSLMADRMARIETKLDYIIESIKK